MTSIEAAKRLAAVKAVEDHFDPSFKYVGIGSGTTIVYVVKAIQELGIDCNHIKFVPTGYQSRQVILEHGLTPFSFDHLPPYTLLDVAFDGADEIDEDLNCIKGGGACLYQEKLVATHAKKFIVVADHRKLQPRLLTSWPTIPIEVERQAAPVVIEQLTTLGSTGAKVRPGADPKVGPLRTDQDNYIVDAAFPTLLIPRDVNKYQSLHPTQEAPAGDGADNKWEVMTLARKIKLIEGVLSVGLFVGVNGPQALEEGRKMGGQKPVAAYFGMTDGSVTIRRAGEVPEDLQKIVDAKEFNPKTCGSDLSMASRMKHGRVGLR